MLISKKGVNMEKEVEKSTLEQLRALNLHETFVTDFGIAIMKVPGGWIYDCWDFATDQYKSGGTFVPNKDG
jgi:hypothetical protein